MSFTTSPGCISILPRTRISLLLRPWQCD